jgi:DNA-binding CsgD family transcriptional regulator
MRATWPLVGRDEILDHAGRDLARDDLAGMVLAGPAGVGKTRLAVEIAEVGAASGFHVERAVAGPSASRIPYGALAPLLPPAATAVERGIAMLGQATEALVQRGGGRRLLLVVDDAQWLDDASALLFQQLVLGRTVYGLATVRTGEPAPDPVQALWKNGDCDRIDVGPLDRRAQDALLEEVLGGQVEGPATQQLWDASHGNVQYLRELVLSGLETNTLVDDAGLWRVVGTISPSERLHDIVGERLAGLDEDESAALELIAFGAPLGVDVVAGLVGSEPLIRLERKGLVETVLDQRRFQASLAHPVHGEVVRERTPLTRAREVQRLLADAVESHGARRRDDVLKVAIWRVEAGGDSSPDLLVEAARQAGFAHDLLTALRLAEAANAIEPSFAAGQIMADCLYSLGRSEETEEVLTALDPAATDDAQRAALARVRAYNRYWHDGDIEEALAAIEDGKGVVVDVEARAELDGLRAVIEVTSGSPREGVARAAPLLREDLGRAAVQGALACGLGLPLLGRADEGMAAVDVGTRAYGRLGGQHTLFEPSLLQVARALALASLGRLDDADEAAVSGYETALVEEDTAGWAFFAQTRGVINLERGLLDDATRWWTEAAALFRSVNHYGPLQWAQVGIALAQAYRGDAVAAAAAVAEVEAHDHPADLHAVNRHRALAWLAVAEGRFGPARGHLEDAVALARKTDQRPFEVSALHDLARLGHATDAADRARQLVDDGALGLLAGACLRHVVARAEADVDGIAGAARDLLAVGANLLGAEASFAAAAEYRRQGSPRDATAWSRRGSEAAEACQGAKTPGLAVSGEPVALTKREREVATLAAGGMTSREIAERLFVSVRTVDNHLGRVYDKLGISSRAELAQAVGVEGG